MQPGEVTQLLSQWRSGDEDALSRLTPLVYDELRRLAGAYMRRERRGHTLQATALVNEAYVRLTEQEGGQFRDRVHFVALAAQMMKRVLIDHGRKKKAGKRGGEAIQLGLDQAPEPEAAFDAEAYEVAEALEILGQENRSLSDIVELRFFGGLTSEEIAEFLNVSVPTVTRRWALARAWLFRHLHENRSDGP